MHAQLLHGSLLLYGLAYEVLMRAGRVRQPVAQLRCKSGRPRAPLAPRRRARRQPSASAWRRGGRCQIGGASPCAHSKSYATNLCCRRATGLLRLEFAPHLLWRSAKCRCRPGGGFGGWAGLDGGWARKAAGNATLGWADTQAWAPRAAHYWAPTPASRRRLSHLPCCTMHGHRIFFIISVGAEAASRHPAALPSKSTIVRPLVQEDHSRST